MKSFLKDKKMENGFSRLHSTLSSMRELNNKSTSELTALHHAAGNHAVGQLVQAKLKISKPNDPSESEADRIADQILQIKKPLTHARDSNARGDISTINQAWKKPRKINSEINFSTSNHFIRDLEHGHPLDTQTRAYMQPRFGQDFSQVRIHTDDKAAKSAEAINARAYAYRNNIVFNKGEYIPDSSTGKRLMAHELAHVVQNSQSGSLDRISCYEGPEHQDIGDRYFRDLLSFLTLDEGKEWVRAIGEDPEKLINEILLESTGPVLLRNVINPQIGELTPVTLSIGQTISLMGDFYGSWQELAQAPVSEIRGILAVMRGERLGRITTIEAAKKYEEITGGRYLRLAQNNDEHFFWRNKAEWRRLHVEAFDLAKRAETEGGSGLFAQALLVDAAAGHFLTDAFAAGHLFDKDQVMAGIDVHLAKHPLMARNPAIQSYIAIVAFAKALPQLILKNVHDRMNREGFVVTNARGMRWRTFGDNYLKQAQETQRIAALAVFLSRQQLIHVRKYDSPNINEVESLLPNDDTVSRATQQAISFIPDAATQVESVIYQNRSLAPLQFGEALGAIISSNLSTVGHPGREREVMQAIDAARRSDVEGPVLPSFTITNW